MPKKSKGSVVNISSDDWQTESDLRTMIDCERIEKDPKRLAKVQALAKQRMLEVAGIATEGKDD